MSYYFASDIHAGGIEAHTQQRLIEWLNSVGSEAEAIFLVGDVFDFWFEYKRVVPKGSVRLLGKFAELTDRGVKIHFFPGNHDMWVEDYLERECGITIHHKGELIDLHGKKVYIEHGDAVPSDDFKVNAMQAIFRSETMRKIFSSIIHPDIALKFGNWWSRSSRNKRVEKHQFRNEEERIVSFARNYLINHDVDIFIFGHLHCPTKYVLNDKSVLYVLGGWFSSDETTYGVLKNNGDFSTVNL